MVDISGLSLSGKREIATYITEDTLETVNKKMELVKPRVSFYTKYGKRLMDILVGFTGFVVSIPFNMVIAIVTFFDVGRPIFFRQERMGKDMKRFVIFKFRNMTNDTDENGELLPASERVTKWGKFVRRTSLDELLNFVSVLKGDMSVIGPRPLIDIYAERLHNRHMSIYMVRPGLECPTLHKIDHELSWQERLDNYVWYVENCSFLTDIKLCFRVVQIALGKRESKRRSEAGHGGFMGYDFDGNVIYTKAVPEKYVQRFLDCHGYDNIEEVIAARKRCERQDRDASHSNH